MSCTCFCSNVNGILAQTIGDGHCEHPTAHLSGQTGRWKTDYLVMDIFNPIKTDDRFPQNSSYYIIHRDRNGVNCDIGNLIRANYDEFYAYMEEHHRNPDEPRVRIVRSRHGVPIYSLDILLVDQETVYTISEDGRVFSLTGEGYDLLYTIVDGVRNVSLSRNRTQPLVHVAQLVLDTFVGYGPQQNCVIHLDRENLNDALENLKRATLQEYNEFIATGQNDQ